jgi:L,D-peptidoglycan transpeptidase YkuD (ErfK/YbiS/YcfS/YnhG family)
VIDAVLGRSLVNVFLLLHAAIEDSESSDLAATSNNHGGTVEMDFSDDSNSLASRMRRQGRTLLGRSGRRRRNREANQSSGPP